MTTKVKKILSIGIKVIVVTLSFWFVYHKITTNQNLEQFFNKIQNKGTVSIWLHLSTVFLLMFVNWFIEALKWQFMTKSFEEMSFIRAVQAIFCGLCWAIFTPNRIGEYGGRIFYLQPRKRIFGVMAMTVGNLAQMVLTNVFGAIALALFLIYYQGLPNVINFLILILSLSFSTLLLIIYFNISAIEKLFLKINFFKKYKSFFKVLRKYKFKDLALVLGFALARFMVFTSQYYIFFNWLLPELQFSHILLMTLILLFVQSALPSLDIFDIGVRSITALYFFHYVTTDEISVIACTAGIWLINIIIPAVIGSIFVFNIKIFDKHRSV